jgi:hypothetical protein
MKFGKLPRKFNRKTLLFHDYLKPDAPPPPPRKVYWEYKIPDDAWNMFGNDTIGDCTCAAIAHMLMLATAHTGALVIPALKDVLAVYSAVTGYDATQTQADGSNATDNGAAITDILQYWQVTGIAGHKILGWAEIDPQNRTSLEQAIYLFGGVDCGFNVPQSAMDQNNAGQTWDIVADDGGIVGGHSVPLFGYGALGDTCITWAKRQQLTNAFFAKYFDEVYAVVTQDWINQSTGMAPNSLKLADLVTALAALKA